MGVWERISGSIGLFETITTRFYDLIYEHGRFYCRKRRAYLALFQFVSYRNNLRINFTKKNNKFEIVLACRDPSKSLIETELMERRAFVVLYHKGRYQSQASMHPHFGDANATRRLVIRNKAKFIGIK